MTDYKILCGRTIDEIEPIVYRFIKMGYVPTGGIFVKTLIDGSSSFYQAICKPKTN